MENKVKNQIQPKPKTLLQEFNSYLMYPGTQQYLESVLHERRQSFVNNMVALVSNSAALQSCTPSSLIYAGLKATALNLPLDPNLGFAYVIPYNNIKEKKTEATFQLGYKGFIQLAIRTGQFATVNVTEIREGELKSRNILTGELVFEAAADRINKKVVGYAAYFALINGFHKALYMTVDEIEAHAKRYSQTYKSTYENIRKTSRWTTDFDAMAKKTVLKLLLSKYAPLSVEMADLRDAIAYDQSVIREDGTADYVDGVDIQEAAIAESIDERKAEMRKSEAKAPTLL